MSSFASSAFAVAAFAASAFAFDVSAVEAPAPPVSIGQGGAAGGKSVVHGVGRIRSGIPGSDDPYGSYPTAHLPPKIVLKEGTVVPNLRTALPDAVSESAPERSHTTTAASDSITELREAERAAIAAAREALLELNAEKERAAAIAADDEAAIEAILLAELA